jgi:hypothetical protein
MNSWTEIIEAHHAWAHPNDGFHLVLRPGATDAKIDEVAQGLGFQPPAEFRDLYRCHDGVGCTHDSQPGKVEWTFVPLADLPSFVVLGRDWFKETHPQLAAAFFAFIDWGCGDYSGYLQARESALGSELYMFEHELYEFEASQDPDEFMVAAQSSITEFLNSR